MTITLPVGCKCDPASYHQPPSEICVFYKPIACNDPYCENCLHDEACHSAVEHVRAEIEKLSQPP